jgi:ADP-ribosylglycohydrolase
MSFCNEIVPKALAVIALTRGRVRETLVAAVNMGRDAASVAAIACGIAGALNGPSDLLPDLVVGVDEAIRRNPFTAVKRTLEQETADLWEAFQAKLASMRALIANAAPRDAGL